MYEITGLDKDGYDYFKLNNNEYSEFPDEKEVLLYPSSPF